MAKGNAKMKTVDRITNGKVNGARGIGALADRPSAEDFKRGKLRVKTIVVPIDFSPESKKALRYASRLAAQTGAALRLVHVVEPAPFLNDLANVALVRSDKEVAQEAAVKLQCLAHDEVEEQTPVQAEVRVGKPHNEIVALAKVLCADLIVIATHGYSGLKHAVLGSTAERVVRHATCPVLVVREKEKDFA
jgi:nucleotide-binding universal stress UspA family protein